MQNFRMGDSFSVVPLDNYTTRTIGLLPGLLEGGAQLFAKDMRPSEQFFSFFSLEIPKTEFFKILGWH